MPRSLSDFSTDIWRAISGRARKETDALRDTIEQLYDVMQVEYVEWVKLKRDHERLTSQHLRLNTEHSHTIKALTDQSRSMQALQSERCAGEWLLQQPWVAIRSRNVDGSYRWTVTVQVPYSSEDFIECIKQAAVEDR